MSLAIGIDLGYGNTKHACRNGVGGIVSGSFRSVVGTDAEVVSLASGFSSSVTRTEVDGVKYLLGESAAIHSPRLLDMRDRGWVNTPQYRALLRHALEKAIEGKDTKGLNQIVTGLPVDYWRNDKDKLKGIVNEVVHAIGFEADVEIVYQPQGSLMDIMFNEDGTLQNTELTNNKWGIIDIGFFTTDYISVNPKKGVIDKESGSIDSGVSTALEAIKKDVENVHGLSNVVLHDIEEAVRKRMIRAYGKSEDISTICHKRLGELAAEISAKITTVWHNGATFDNVVLTGGGAEMLRYHWNLYKHSRVLPRSGMANATGYCKYASRILARR